MKRLCWSTLCLAAMATQVIHAAGTVSVDGQGSVPSVTQNIGARIPAAGAGRQFQGLAVTDYFTFEQNYTSPANPDLAVGPDDILGIVNRQIFRLPNPNAPGVTPSTNPNAQKAFLDVWIGEQALQELCPTQPRTGVSCLFEHATVRYDQMHGRFVVLFTVTDTGLILQQTNPPGYQLGQPRKASWVILVSRYAVLSTRDAAVPQPGNSDIFVRPTPPSGSVTGGLNDKWFVWYGGGQGFGSPAAGGANGPGNINALPGRTAGNEFNCGINGIQGVDGQGVTLPVTSACYFPTSARLGIDNDTITIVSSVINANIRRPSFINNPPAEMPAYAGNRIRVIKKAALYTQVFTPLTAGDQFAAVEADRFAGSYYDLYTSIDDLGTPVTAPAYIPWTAISSVAPSPTGPEGVVTTGFPSQLAPLFYEPAHLRGRTMATFSNSPTLNKSQTYLVGAVSNDVFENTLYVQGIQHIYPATNIVFPGPDNGPLGAVLRFYPVLKTTTGAGRRGLPSPMGVEPFANPARAPQAGGTTVTYSGTVTVSNGNVVTLTTGGPSFSASLVGRIIRIANLAPTVFSNYLVTAVANSTQLTIGTNVAAGTYPFTAEVTTGAPRLYVGDDRPHRVIFREGHLYEASVVDAAVTTNQVGFTPAFTPLDTTVRYHVIRKLAHGDFPTIALTAKWQNAVAYAPMYDAPANVSQQGVASPINLFPYLEKLFVGTTYPPLTPLAQSRDGANDPRYRDVTGALIANCSNPQSNPSVGGLNLAWPGLFDVKCGEDPYDGAQSYRNPATGEFFASTLDDPFVPFGIRGGAATDPNDLSLWVYGAYARKRLATIPTGQWGTYGANYKLAFQAEDPYNNATSFYTDISVDPSKPNFRASAIYAQIARQLGIGPAGDTFGPDTPVTRAEMARWVILGQMNEQAVTDYLNNTPQFGAPNSPSFADVPASHPQFRYIEVMYRRGYTKGCVGNDAIRLYCPAEIITRGQMAVFLIRAKLNNVFPTVLSGCPVTPSGTISACGLNGDNFGLFVSPQNYFQDNPAPVPTNPATAIYPYIQKIAELRISNGFTLGQAGNGLNGIYGANDPLTREQIAVFVIRAFHP